MRRMLTDVAHLEEGVVVVEEDDERDVERQVQRASRA